MPVVCTQHSYNKSLRNTLSSYSRKVFNNLCISHDLSFLLRYTTEFFFLCFYFYRHHLCRSSLPPLHPSGPHVPSPAAVWWRARTKSLPSIHGRRPRPPRLCLRTPRRLTCAWPPRPGTSRPGTTKGSPWSVWFAKTGPQDCTTESSHAKGKGL